MRYALRMTRMPPTEAARFFREERFRLGMTQPQFGKFLGVTQNTISRWERGHAPKIALTIATLLRERRSRQ